MDPENNDELLEEYEDALLRLMMNEYMEQEGNRLLQEMEELEAKGELPEVPPELDARCRKLIADARENGRRKEMVMRVIKTAGRVAAILMITIGFLISLVFSVEAIRVPVVNFVVEQYEKYSVLHGLEGNSQQGMPGFVLTKASAEKLLERLLPNTFDKIYDYESTDGMFTLVYQSIDGRVVILGSCGSYDELSIDSENADCRTIDIGGYEGVIVCKASDIDLYVSDSVSDRMYWLCAEKMDVSDVISLAEQLVMEGERRK